MTASTQLALQEAAEHHRAGRLDRAEAGCRRVLDSQPDHAEAHHLLGLILAQARRGGEALTQFERAVALKPDNARFRLDLGSILGNLGRLDAAIDCFRKSLELDPKNIAALGNLAFALGSLGRLDESADRYRAFIRRDPKNARAHYGLGCALMGMNRLDQAIACFRDALRLEPKSPDIYNNLGTALIAQGQLGPAAEAYQAALQLQPNFFEARLNFGMAVGRLGRADLAAENFMAALKLRPDSAEARQGLGDAFVNLGRLADAEIQYRAAIELKPGSAALHGNLGTILASLDRREDAIAAFETALGIDAGWLGVRANLMAAKLPVLYRDEAEIAASRAAYEADLGILLATAEAQIEAGQPMAPEATGEIPPFFLAYQGQDDRALQTQYGRFLGTVMAAARPHLVEAPAVERPTGKIRVGFLSASFWDHAVWRILIKGWLTGLDRDRFELYGYHVGARTDAETEAAASLCHRFISGRRPFDVWAETVRADKLHLLIFPDLGMDALTLRLASLRLAPVQATSWAHPETSGLATIDAFLSSDLMEPKGAEAAYTETLVRLPNLGIYYEPPALEPAVVARAQHGIPEDGVLYWCCQSLFKYLPQHDGVFARIAKSVPNAHFAFLGFQRGETVTDIFRARLAAAFAAEGLDWAAHCTILPRLSAAEFAGVTRLADIFLDSIGWAGGNTTLEALESCVPVVTQAGPLLRGRHGSAILTRLGVPELIAADEAAYLDLAIRLGQDAVMRKDLSAKIAAGRELLYRDQVAIDGLAAWIEGAVG